MTTIKETALTIHAKYKNINDLLYAYEKASDCYSYMYWVALWKNQYQELSEDIRKIKYMRKMTGSNYDECASWIRCELGDVATRMLFVRHEAKAWSLEQKKERRAEAA